VRPRDMREVELLRDVHSHLLLSLVGVGGVVSEVGGMRREVLVLRLPLSVGIRSETVATVGVTSVGG
jgi:hypothetical protein